MENENFARYDNITCTEDLHAPPERVQRSPAAARDVARYWRAKGPSMPLLLDEIARLILDKHTGRQFWNGQEIERFAVDPGTGDDWIDQGFGRDPFRDIGNFLNRANGGYKNRLTKSVQQRALLLHFARKIDECLDQQAAARHHDKPAD